MRAGGTRSLCLLGCLVGREERKEGASRWLAVSRAQAPLAAAASAAATRARRPPRGTCLLCARAGAEVAAAEMVEVAAAALSPLQGFPLF